MPLSVSAYLSGAAAGLLARAVMLVSGVGSLWLLTRILSKAEFGTYSFVMALVFLLATVATVGLERTLLYRVSRLEPGPQQLAGGDFAAAVMRAVLMSSGALTASLFVAGYLVGDLSRLPDLGFWMVLLAMTVPLLCLGQVFEAWYWARQRVTISVLVPSTNHLTRMVFLACALVVLPTPGGVALAAIAGAAVPLLIWWTILPRGALRPASPLSAGDIGYGINLMLAKLASEGIKQVDLLMLGFLTTAAVTADYAVAARIAALVSLGSAIVSPVLKPRIGRYLALSHHLQIRREYDQVRLMGFVAALCGAAALAALGEWMLPLFGDYGGSYPVLIILAAGFLASAGFGPNAGYLNMAGHARWSLLARLLTLGAVVASNLVLIPLMGAKGAALGTAFSLLAANVLMSLIIWRLDRMATMSPGLVVAVGLAFGLLLLLGFDALSGFLASIGLCALAVPLLVMHSPLWLPVVKQLVGCVGRTG